MLIKGFLMFRPLELDAVAKRPILYNLEGDL